VAPIGHSEGRFCERKVGPTRPVANVKRGNKEQELGAAPCHWPPEIITWRSLPKRAAFSGFVRASGGQSLVTSRRSAKTVHGERLSGRRSLRNIVLQLGSQPRIQFRFQFSRSAPQLVAKPSNSCRQGRATQPANYPGRSGRPLGLGSGSRASVARPERPALHIVRGALFAARAPHAHSAERVGPQQSARRAPMRSTGLFCTAK